MSTYWFDSLSDEQSWTSLWSGYIICGQCRGIRKVTGRCPVCNCEIPNQQFNTFMGAEGRYEDYVYLNMMEFEWRRPISKYDNLTFLNQGKRPAAKAIIVLVFWTYFETRIERLLDNSMRELPNSIRQNLFKRYQSISARTDELYKILFGKTNSYFMDLEDLGFGNVAKLLLRIQDKRNEFMHGKPESIDDLLIDDIVKYLKEEHESWIKVFNLRTVKSS